MKNASARMSVKAQASGRPLWLREYAYLPSENASMPRARVRVLKSWSESERERGGGGRPSPLPLSLLPPKRAHLSSPPAARWRRSGRIRTFPVHESAPDLVVPVAEAPHRPARRKTPTLEKGRGVRGTVPPPPSPTATVIAAAAARPHLSVLRAASAPPPCRARAPLPPCRRAARASLLVSTTMPPARASPFSPLRPPRCSRRSLSCARSPTQKNPNPKPKTHNSQHHRPLVPDGQARGRPRLRPLGPG